MSRLLTLWHVLTAAAALLAVSAADASNRASDPHLERARTFAIQTALAPEGGKKTATPVRSLGTAVPTVNSRGALIAQTWYDRLASSAVGRTVAANPVTSLVAGTQFVWTDKAGPLSGNLNTWGYRAYDATTGKFVTDTGLHIVQWTNPASTESGSFPRIALLRDGRAVIAGYDYADRANDTNVQIHTVWDDGLMKANFGDIWAGSRISDAIERSGNFGGGTNAIWPTMDLSEYGGQTVVYVAAFELNSVYLGAMKVYRKVGLDAAAPDTNWTLVFTDSGYFPSQDISCAQGSAKVAVAWIKPTAHGMATEQPADADIWYAESPTGLPGTWTRTNVTTYSGAGYRAYLELACLYDSEAKFHIVWNGSKTDGVDFGGKECRLFHWSQWNPSNIYTVYKAEWDPSRVACSGRPNVLNVGHISIGECGIHLAIAFVSFNDSVLTGHNDDCADNNGYTGDANGELFVSMSKDLQGKSFDIPRNVTNSYTPGCVEGDCADDRSAVLARRSVEDLDFAGTETWPPDALFPEGSTSTERIDLMYVTDRYPGYAAVAGNGPFTLNDLRWVRLSCQPNPLCWLWISPTSVDYPTFVRPSQQLTVPVMLSNQCSNPTTINSVQCITDNGPSGWLTLTGYPASVLSGAEDTVTLTLNAGGIIGYSGVFFGRVKISWGSPATISNIEVRLIVTSQGIPQTQWDTVTTSCLSLTVSTNGNMGHSGNYTVGGANMNFVPFTEGGPECDTGVNSRGDASVYLYDASPVVIRHPSTNSYVASWAIFNDGFESPNGFKVLNDSSTSGSSQTERFDIMNSGSFCTIDSLLKIQKTWFAPKRTDSCNFILQRMRIFPFIAGQSVSNLAIGEAFDWDVPSDSNYTWDIGGYVESKNLVYMRGYNKADTIVDCRDNSLRYAGAALLVSHYKNCAWQTSLYGGYNAANDSFVYPAGTFVPEQLWNNMQRAGFSTESRMVDLHSVLTYKNVASTGFTLPANDTLTIWTVMATLRTAASISAGLDSLKGAIDKAKKMVMSIGTEDRCTNSCCTLPTRGDVNGDDKIDLGDISWLVAYLTIFPKPILPCPAAANVNATGIIDLADLSLLISYLTSTPRPTLPPCGP